MRQFTITANDEDQRLDKFLQKALPNLPKSAVYKGLRTKHIKLNKHRAYGAARLSAGDVVTVFLRDADIENTQPDFLSAPNDVRIVFEDEQVILLHKPAGLLVHEDANQKRDTLVNRMLRYLYVSGVYDPSQENSFVPALCNRLDRHTEGIVLGAKTAPALRTLNEAIRHGHVHKQYLCIVHGTPAKREDTLKAFCRKNEDLARMEVFDVPVPDGRTMLTRYRVLSSKNGFSLLEIDLLTGRTHQIRTHMAHMGHPLLGDGKYGVLDAKRDHGFTHQALCAYKVTFTEGFLDTPLAYLCGKSFTLPHVQFAEDFLHGRF